MKFAKIVFLSAGVIGLCEITPLFFAEQMVNEKAPPAITHPEFYYGFMGVVLAWQFVYLTIGTDPVRYRPMMICAIFAKLVYAMIAFTLFSMGRMSDAMLPGPSLDLVWSVVFVVAYFKTGRLVASQQS